MTRLADLLQQGVIMKRKFQPYEAHLQYLLQFMVDYNLYGCDYLESSKTAFRSPVPAYDAGSNSSHLWHSQSVLPQHITDDPSLPRVSHCSIEVDICVQHIANRQAVKERQLHHDFIERKFPIPANQKLVFSLAGLWRDETKRRQRQMLHGKQGLSPFPPDVLVSMSADARQSQPQGWIHEEEYVEQITELVNAELARLDDQHPKFEDFVERADPDEEVHTALQSVEDLFPNNLIPALGLSSSMTQLTGEPPASSIEVDEKKILQELNPGDEFFPDDSDEERLREFTRAEHSAENDIGQDAAAAVTEIISANSGSLSTAIKPLQPSSHLMPGLCLSVLSTGSLPAVPVSQELLDAAEDEGLVGRVPRSKALRHQKLMARKRQGPVASSTSSPQKRLKSYNATPAADYSSSPKLSGFRSVNQRHSTFSSPRDRSSPSSSDPLAASDRALNYAITKEQSGESPKARFSQRSQISPVKRE
ncbi:DNA polymerase zeta [Metarhizium acridum]|nr:DNA polymerase zeta [Metarhizium acridum]